MKSFRANVLVKRKKQRKKEGGKEGKSEERVKEWKG